MTELTHKYFRKITKLQLELEIFKQFGFTQLDFYNYVINKILGGICYGK